jgi:hypothetical protein
MVYYWGMNQANIVTMTRAEYDHMVAAKIRDAELIDECVE